MGSGQIGELALPGPSPLHRLAPEAKVAAAVLFLLAVVTTPREQAWAFAAYGAAILALARLGAVPLATLARRLTVEVPFVAFALLLPLVAPDGWWAAWNILAKATLGVATSVVLTATTPVSDLVVALRRLRVPAALTTVVTFMVRYLDVVVGEVQRMQTARLSRADDPRWLWQVRSVARTAGTAFVRCYERGERVHLAMVARGYDGTVPAPLVPAASAKAWATALALPAAAAAVSTGAWLLR